MLNHDMEQAPLDFPAIREAPGYVYLDNAATSLKPDSVLEAVTAYYRQCNANVHRTIHRWGEEATRRYEDARKKLATFIGSSSSREIIFTSGTTDAINLVAATFCRTLSPGDEIILSVMEHHSNLVPWQIQGEIHGLKLKFIPVTDSGELDLNALETLWSPKTKFLSLSHMSNVLGTINPVKKIISQAHNRGVKVLLDAAQTVPHMTVDVQDLDCDFLAFSGHKMCGPSGIGVLWGRREILESLPPWKGGGEMIRSVTLEHSQWNSLPYKFEAGTPNIAGAIGLGAAADYLSKWGMSCIEEKEKKLIQRLLAGLDSLKGFRIYGRAAHRGGIAAFTRQGIHAHDLVQYLDAKGFALRAGHHCAHPLARRMNALSTARASVYFYNREEEIDGLLEALDAKEVHCEQPS